MTVKYSQTATDILSKINNIASYTDLRFPIRFHNSPCLTTSKSVESDGSPGAFRTTSALTLIRRAPMVAIGMET